MKYSNSDNYAEQLLLASCLSKEGIKWPVPWQDMEESSSPVTNQAGRRLFNTDIAEKYGFHVKLVMSTSDQLWEAFITYQPTEPGFQEAFDTCLAGIRKKYPIPDPGETGFSTGLAYQAQQEALLKPEAQKAADRWRSCMEPQGLGQLPENPNAFPSPEFLDELGTNESVQPSEREMAIAMAHANCLDSSGFSATMYNLEWALQQKLVEQNRTKLDNIRRVLRDREADVRKIIAANAPKA